MTPEQRAAWQAARSHAAHQAQLQQEAFALIGEGTPDLAFLRVQHEIALSQWENAVAIIDVIMAG